MNGIIWLWKHRHCWEQLRYLYSHRYSIKLALGTSSNEDAADLLAHLRDFDRIPLTRPSKVLPPQIRDLSAIEIALMSRSEYLCHIRGATGNVKKGCNTGQCEITHTLVE